MIAHEELNSNAYDDIRFQRVIVEEMGELLPAPLLAECDLTGVGSVLEIGCGAGEWLRAMARRYPDLQCIGIEQDDLLVKAANALAYRDGLPQVAFLAVEMNDIPPTLFAHGSFDLVHLSFLGRYILTAEYRALAQTCAAFCRPGGIVCWTEAELPHTTSPAFERLAALVCQAVQNVRGERLWEVTEHVAAHPGENGSKRFPSQQHALSITPMLGHWLRDAGCGGQRETPAFSIWGINPRVIHQTAYTIEVSAGQPSHAGFVGQARRFAHQIKPLLLRTEVIEEEEYTALCDQLETELTNQEFCGMSFLVRAWAPRP